MFLLLRAFGRTLCPELPDLRGPLLVLGVTYAGI